VTPRFDSADIKRYYDRHTTSFVRFGQGRASIHRAVWGPDVQTQEQAFHYVDDQIAALVGQGDTPLSAAHVVDLGCGVGASLCYLAERLPIRGTGVTLSPAQAVMAGQFIAEAGLSERVECFEGDYTNLPPAIEPADLAYAIESFVHGPAPERFFEQSHRVLNQAVASSSATTSGQANPCLWLSALLRNSLAGGISTRCSLATT